MTAPAGGDYDTSIGTSVDADGFAQLPLRSGAHRYFVNSATGSDSNGCSGAQQASTPLKTVAAGVACVQNGLGDQVLLAEGSTFGEAIPYIGTATKDGSSAQYPTVIESYDPADPSNEAEYGRGDHRNARPVLTGVQGAVAYQGPNYFVIKGLDLSPAANAVGSLTFTADSDPTHGSNYVLIENNILRYTGIAFTEASQSAGTMTASHLIIRNNSIYGMWSSGGIAGGLYVSGASGITVEDNVFWHCGWNTSVGRDEAGYADHNAYVAAGGATVFSHSYYLQTNTTGAVVRRNLSADGAGDGGIARGDSTFSENLFIDNPAAIGVGGGPNYNTERPNGVKFDVGYNAIIGDADVSSTHQMGWAINTTDGQSGSRVHNNLILRSRNPNGPSMSGLANGASFNQPSYAQYDHNVIYQWVSQSNQTYSYADPSVMVVPSQVFSTYDSNVWDGLALGTNTNNASANFPNPYTAAQLYAALGYADKASFINYVINHPEAHVQRSARSLLFQGYGM